MEARIKQPKQAVEHQDQIGQAIRPGQPVVFAYAYTAGVRIGTVEKLTAKRIAIRYKYQYLRNDGTIQTGEWRHYARPERTLVLPDSIPQELTMLKLKGLLP